MNLFFWGVKPKKTTKNKEKSWQRRRRSTSCQKLSIPGLWSSDQEKVFTFFRTDRNRTDRNRTGPGPDPDRSDIRGAKASHHGSWIIDQRLKIKDQWSSINDQRSSIMDQGSSIKYQVSSIKDQGSRIKDLGPWTWHEWPSWTGYRREIKTIRIYYQRSIILYRFYKDTIK